MLSKTLTLATLTSLASAQATSDSSLPFPIPTSYISSISNHVGGTQTQTQPETAATRSDCTTVTMQGEPMFTIQTDTMTPTGCTYTVFGSSMANNTSIVMPTFSSLPVPVAPGPVVTAANGTNATMTMAGTGGMMTSTSSGMAGGAGGSMSTSGSGMGSSTTGSGGSNGGSGGSGSGTSSASGSSASSTDSAANAHAILAGEAVGLAALGAAFMLL